MNWPIEIEKEILKVFGSGRHKAYGQIATVSKNHAPSVRTVHIHAISDPEKTLIISSHIKSEKWKSLLHNNQVAGCYWDPDSQMQYRFEGLATLMDENDPKNEGVVQAMWLKMREGVRTAYLLDEKGIDLRAKKVGVDANVHSKNHGVVLIRPKVWDLFQNHSKEYRFGRRFIYREKNGEWKKREVNSLYS